MSKIVREVMTKDPIVLASTTDLVESARRMRDEDVGDVLVQQHGSLCGIVTDRDIVTTALADGKAPNETTLSEVCTHELHAVEPDDDVDEVVAMMERESIRRAPVLENDVAVGILSLGDLAMEKDPDSALARISAAEQNN